MSLRLLMLCVGPFESWKHPVPTVHGPSLSLCTFTLPCEEPCSFDYRFSSPQCLLPISSLSQIGPLNDTCCFILPGFCPETLPCHLVAFMRSPYASVEVRSGPLSLPLSMLIKSQTFPQNIPVNISSIFLCLQCSIWHYFHNLSIPNKGTFYPVQQPTCAVCPVPCFVPLDVSKSRLSLRGGPGSF